MIADSQTGTKFSSSVGYITDEGRATEVKTRNVFNEDDPKQAAREMQITADLRERVEKPVYSLSIGYHPEEEISDEEMLEDMEELLERRGLGEHQAVLATHRDKPHPHVHATVNRVHPQSRELWRDSFDRLKNMDTLREIEQERGRISPRDVVSEEESEQRGRVADWKLRRFERTGDLPFGQEVQAQAGDAFAEAETWEDLQSSLASHGLHVEEKGSGGVVTDGSEEAPLSEVARSWSFNKLQEQFPDQFRDYERSQREDGRRSRAEKKTERGSGADPGASRGGHRREGIRHAGGYSRRHGDLQEDSRTGGEDLSGQRREATSDRSGSRERSRQRKRDGRRELQAAFLDASGEDRDDGWVDYLDAYTPLDIERVEPLRPSPRSENDRGGAEKASGAFENRTGDDQHERGGVRNVRETDKRESAGGGEQPDQITQWQPSKHQREVEDGLHKELGEDRRSGGREAAEAWRKLSEQEQEELRDHLPERWLKQLRQAIKENPKRTKGGGRSQDQDQSREQDQSRDRGWRGR